MKKEDAVELADKCLKELAASLEQGQTEVLEKYLSALARFHDYSFRNMMMIVNQFPTFTWQWIIRSVACRPRRTQIFSLLSEFWTRRTGNSQEKMRIFPSEARLACFCQRE